jgi:hypothetical protein
MMDPAEATRGLQLRGLPSLRAGELGVNCPGVDKLLNILEDDPVAQNEDVQTRSLKGVRQELRSTWLVQCGLGPGAVSAHSVSVVANPGRRSPTFFATSHCV